MDSRNADELGAVLAGMREPLVMLDSEWRVRGASAAAACMLNLSADALHGRSFRDLMPDLAASDEAAHLRAAMDRGSATTFVYQPPGQQRPLRVRAEPSEAGLLVFWQEEVPAGGESTPPIERTPVNGPSTDDDLNVVEARARARADEIDTIMNSVPAIVWIAHDPEARWITGSRTSYEFLGLPEGTNQSITAGLGGEQREFRVYQDGVELARDQLPLRRAARGEQVAGFEGEVRFDDGTSKYMIGNATPLYDDHGRPRGAVGAFVEITSRIRAEQERRPNAWTANAGCSSGSCSRCRPA